MTSQYGAYALRAGKARLHARTRMHTPTRRDTRTHAYAHRTISNTYYFSTEAMIRESASMLRYTHITCLVLGYKISTFFIFRFVDDIKFTIRDINVKEKLNARTFCI